MRIGVNRKTKVVTIFPEDPQDQIEAMALRDTLDEIGIPCQDVISGGLIYSLAFGSALAEVQVHEAIEAKRG